MIDRYLHDPDEAGDECWVRTAPGVVARNAAHERAERLVDVNCWSCRARRRRAQDLRRRAVRQRPELPARPPRHCRLCGEPVTGRRLNWCSDACVDLWMAAGSATRLLPQLVALHGRECWTCGARWQPGWAPTPRSWGDYEHPLLGPPEPVRVVLEVDHVRPLWSLDDDERTELRWWLPFNLQALCTECHRAKTAAEAAERARRRRPTGHHQEVLV